MLSKSQDKYIRSLSQQKFRDQFKVFLAEGAKIAKEWLLTDEPVKIIVATAQWAEQNEALIDKHNAATLHIVTDTELAHLSALPAPNQVLLVVERREQMVVPAMSEWCLALDRLQDPGNMGTIIRIADWFGVKHIACSPGCVDVYNPKVVQSAMGGQLRVNIFETDLAQFLTQTKLPVIAATLDGENIYTMAKPDAAVLIIGNESKGISPEIQALATHKVRIPGKGGAESLNAGVSAGIICALLMPA